MAEAIQRSSLTQSLHLKVDSSLQGTSSSGILPQGTGGSSKPVDEADLQHVASQVGRLHLAMIKLPGRVRKKLKKAR
jgi:hypothetical protein